MNYLYLIPIAAFALISVLRYRATRTRRAIKERLRQPTPFEYATRQDWIKFRASVGLREPMIEEPEDRQHRENMARKDLV